MDFKFAVPPEAPQLQALNSFTAQTGSARADQHLRSAMAVTVQDAEIGFPGTDCITILVGHHAR